MFKRLSVTGYAAQNALHHFICDDASDIENLPTLTEASPTMPQYGPCNVGSTAIVVDAQAEYILNNSNEWKMFRSLVGGTTITTDDGNIDVASLGEITDYIH